MQERTSPHGWIERRSTERLCDADTPLHIIGAALCAYGKPIGSTFAHRGVWIGLALQALTKPNRSKTARSRTASPIK